MSEDNKALNAVVQNISDRILVQLFLIGVFFFYFQPKKAHDGMSE